MSNSSIDRSLSGSITPGKGGSGNDGNEGVFRIPQSSSITCATPSNCFMSYQDTSLSFINFMCINKLVEIIDAVNSVYCMDALHRQWIQ